MNKDFDAGNWTRGHGASTAYHSRLLADTGRMDAYHRALRALVRPGDVVLDLGCGTGVLAMLAARAGAARVHAVESMPIAELAVSLVRANGLAERVTVHHAELTELSPVEPVDLVVSDFMGRFVVDDGMLPAVAASRGWTHADTRFCPAEVALRVAPVGIGHFEPLDTYRSLVAGLDLSAAEQSALAQCHGAELSESALLADAATLLRLVPPDVDVPIGGTTRFVCRRAGRLRGIAGWFDATLAPGVSLSTAPGQPSHWGQMLFPVPVTAVASGDTIALDMRWDGTGPTAWRWEGHVSRGGSERCRFRLEDESPARWAVTAPAPAADIDVEAANDAGAAAFERADYPAAVGAFERAVRGLPSDDGAHRSVEIYENLGIAYLYSGRPRAAVGPLLRALDGDAASREQSARLLVDACFRGHLSDQGERALCAYETAFGRHPAGWRRALPGEPDES